MATITVNVDDETAQRFRRAAWAAFGKGKGSIGKAVAEAFRNWMKTSESDPVPKAIALLEKGFNMGGLKYKHRSELYDRV